MYCLFNVLPCNFNGYCSLPDIAAALNITDCCDASAQSSLTKGEDMGRRFGKSCLVNDDILPGNMSSDHASPGNRSGLFMIR